MGFVVVYCDELNMEFFFSSKDHVSMIDVFCSMSWSAEMYWCLFGQQPLECLPSLPCVAHGMSCSAPCGTSPTVKGHPRMDDVFDATSQNNHL